MAVGINDPFDKDIFESQWIVKLKQMVGYTGFSHLWGQTRVVNGRYIKTADEMRSTDRYPEAKLEI